jgi:hypothetical protein
MTTAAAREPLPRTTSLLLVADAWCDGKSMCKFVSDAILDRRATVFVVSPALTGWLHSFVSDIDGAIAAAELRLNAVLDELHAAGVAAEGSVGDEDPLLAIEDSLHDFPATEILVVTDSSQQNWRERHVSERLAALGLPFTFVHVS